MTFGKLRPSQNKFIESNQTANQRKWQFSVSSKYSGTEL